MEENELTEDEAKQEREELSAEVFEDKLPDESANELEEDAETDQIEEEEDPTPEESQFDNLASELNTKVQTALGSFEDRLKQSEKRIGGLQNQTPAKQPQETVTKEQIAEAAKTPEGWEELREDYPELINGIEAMFNTKQQPNAVPEIEAIRNELNSLKASQGGLVNKRILEERVLTVIHPDFKEIIEDNDYKKWLLDQPREVQQAAAQSENADDAIAILTAYKYSSGKTQNVIDSRNQRLQRSVSTKKTKANQPAKAETDMSNAEVREKIAKEFWPDS